MGIAASSKKERPEFYSENSERFGPITSCYKTADGQIFDSWNAAVSHQAFIELEFWYDHHPMVDAKGEYVDLAMLLEWLVEHKGIIMKVYNIPYCNVELK